MRFRPFPILETPRLLIRQMTLTDAPSVLFLRSDGEVNRYIFRKAPPPSTIEDGEDFINRCNQSIAKGENIYWAVSLKSEPQKMVGTLCLWNFTPDAVEAEVGYDLMPHLHGQGLLSEGLPIVLDYGFQKLGVQRIVALTHHANKPSHQLLYKNNFQILKDRKDTNNPHNIIFGLEA